MLKIIANSVQIIEKPTRKCKGRDTFILFESKTFRRLIGSSKIIQRNHFRINSKGK